ncbi:AraC family transcriptional regulator [Oenococcus sicerae]|uniref:AraC family transcriptional regulator n=1 Tax=Oenococcus sicerae TaxID=2203724 RepID=UPI0039ECB71E
MHHGQYINIPKHWHRSLELSYTYSGSIPDYTISGKHYTTHPGSILIMNTNEVHSIFFPPQVVNDKGTSALTLLFPYQFLSQMIPDYRYRWYQIDDQATKDLDQLKQKLKIFFEFISQENNAIDKIEEASQAANILYLLTKNFSKITDTPNSLIVSTDKETSFERLDEVISFIQEHSHSPLPVSKIAKHFNLSTSYLSRIFKYYTGEAIIHYLNLIRLQEGLQLLLNSKKTIQAISNQVGFSNQKSFIRIFKKVYQITPADYQKKYFKSNR